MGDWVRDDLPDLLWPALTLVDLGTSEAVRFVRWQGAVQKDLAGLVEPEALADGLDGRLTSLDKLAELHPDAREIIKRRAVEHGILPMQVAKALASYPERPAAWLTDIELESPGQEEINLLAKAVMQAVGDGHREAIIKCLSIWSSVQAGQFRADGTTIDLLRVYPNDAEALSKTDTVVRASWGARKGLELYRDAARYDSAIRWAKTFWDVNSMTSRCIRRREVEESVLADSDPESSVEDGDSGVGEGVDLQRFATGLFSSYIEALETAPARLYDQECQEVNAGLVARAAREVITALGNPDLWCLEHGAHVGRMLVEVRIYVEWMAKQDPAIYRAFQEYGAGKAKLYSRLMSEIPQDWLRPGVSEAIDELNRLSHNDEVIDHRVVDTRDSFAGGKSLRAMAEESGLIDLYRHAYYISSGVTHSEWWSIETHCMERCMNILHRAHLIPSLSLSAGNKSALAMSWVESLHALIRVSLRILETDEDAVNSAFSWMSTEGESETGQAE
ncbi:DUF5677 domain-containing protein [Lentzea sp. NPDC058450]|uniref:DUF5677 domain-containing protein n=1 Tax=Lentzea sp. NPDC058450 TaxID=3346505 RepID=UPI00364DBEFD